MERALKVKDFLELEKKEQFRKLALLGLKPNTKIPRMFKITKKKALSPMPHLSIGTPKEEIPFHLSPLAF